MSYDIDFVKSDKLSSENIDEFLSLEASENDQHFVSSALKNEIKGELASNGLKFETFEGKQDDYVELNFESFQLSMFNSEIALSLPYWDTNGSDRIHSEVKLISKILIERGFTGYDPQTERFFTESGEFSTDFGQANEKVNELFTTEFAPQVNNVKNGGPWRLIKFGIVFIVVAFLIRLLFSLLSRLF